MRRKRWLGPLGRRQCEGNWIDTEPNERVLRIAKYRVAVVYAQHNFLRRIELKTPTEIERQRRDPVRDGGEETAAVQNQIKVAFADSHESGPCLCEDTDL